MSGLCDAEMERQYNNRAAVPDYADYLESWRLRSGQFRYQLTGLLH